MFEPKPQGVSSLECTVCNRVTSSGASIQGSASDTKKINGAHKTMNFATSSLRSKSTSWLHCRLWWRETSENFTLNWFQLGHLWVYTGIQCLKLSELLKKIIWYVVLFFDLLWFVDVTWKETKNITLTWPNSTRPWCYPRSFEPLPRPGFGTLERLERRIDTLWHQDSAWFSPMVVLFSPSVKPSTSVCKYPALKLSQQKVGAIVASQTSEHRQSFFWAKLCHSQTWFVLAKMAGYCPARSAWFVVASGNICSLASSAQS